MRDALEQCDDGNQRSGDGCNTYCQTEFCSDHAVQAALGEQCDDGNGISGDGCSSACLLESVPHPAAPEKPQVSKPQQSADALRAAMAMRKSLLADLLKKLVSTADAREILRRKGIDSTTFDVYSIDGFFTAFTLSEVERRTTADIAVIRAHGIEVGDFTSGKKPIELLRSLLALRDVSDRNFHGSLEESATKVQAAVQNVRQLLPVFVREYGMDTKPVLSLLETIDRETEDVTVASAARTNIAMDALLAELERQGVTTRAELASLSPPDMAINAERIAREAGQTKQLEMNGDTQTFVSTMAEIAPQRYRKAFEIGTLENQKKALHQLLVEDSQVTSFLLLLSAEPKAVFEQRLTALQSDIDSIGKKPTSSRPCAASMQVALGCSQTFLTDLQNAVRNRNMFFRVVGYVQDYFTPAE